MGSFVQQSVIYEVQKVYLKLIRVSTCVERKGWSVSNPTLPCWERMYGSLWLHQFICTGNKIPQHGLKVQYVKVKPVLFCIS